MSQEVEHESGELEVAPEILSEAKELGWAPLEEFKGDPEKWVDAATFVERGKHIMPILRKNNERLRQDLLRRDSEIGTLRQSLAGMNETVARLEQAYNEGLKRQLKAQRAELRKELVEARREDDVDREVEVQEQIDALAEEERRVSEQKPAPKTPVEPEMPGLSQEVVSWKKDNPWFGVDKAKTKKFLRTVEDLRDEGETSVGEDFLNLAYEKAFAEEKPNVSKVEGGTPRGGTPGSSPRSKGFSSLPKEAQDACMQDVEQFVGPGKKFKAVAEWQAYYTKLYNGEPV